MARSCYLKLHLTSKDHTMEQARVGKDPSTGIVSIMCTAQPPSLKWAETQAGHAARSLKTVRPQDRCETSNKI